MILGDQDLFIYLFLKRIGLEVFIPQRPLNTRQINSYFLVSGVVHEWEHWDLTLPT